MDAVELPLPAAFVSKIMRSSGGCSGGGGGVTRVEFSKSERDLSSSSSFIQDKDDNRNVNGSRPAFWSKMSDEDLYRQGGQLTSLRNEEALVDHDMGSVPEAKNSLRKSGKAVRSNGNSSRRSRVAHMEATLNVTGEVNISDVPKELGPYSGKYNILDKTQIAKQKTVISGKRSDKRNGKVSKSRFDSFSIKAGLSSFSSAAAGGNNMLGVYGYGLKHDLYDFEKPLEEISLNELLDGSYKCPKSIKENEKKTEVLHKSILVSIRAASSILHLQKPKQTPNVAAVDGTHNHNASSSLPNPAVSGISTNSDNKGDTTDPSSCNKVDSSSPGLADHQPNILQFPLVPPKDVLDRLSLPPPKDLDAMLLDSMKPTSTSRVQNGGSLPTFPWSHVSGFKANPDVVKSTPSKSSCQGKWFRMRKSTTTSSGDTTSYLEDFQSLTYNKSLVPLECQQAGPIENEKSPMLSVSNATFDREVTPSETHTTSLKRSVEHSAGALSAAQILCDIAARCRKLDQDGMVRWQKKSSQKSLRASKLTSDEKLEKALFTIPSSKFIGPSNLINGPDETKSHTPKKFRMPVNEKSNDFSNPTTKGPYPWPTVTPQSSRSSPNKTFKNTSMEAKHESSSSGMKRAITTPPSRLPSKPPKLRKLVPMEWKSRGDQKGNGKY